MTIERGKWFNPSQDPQSDYKQGSSFKKTSSYKGIEYKYALDNIAGQDTLFIQYKGSNAQDKTLYFSFPISQFFKGKGIEDVDQDKLEKVVKNLVRVVKSADTALGNLESIKTIDINKEGISKVTTKTGDSVDKNTVNEKLQDQNIDKGDSKHSTQLIKTKRVAGKLFNNLKDVDTPSKAFLPKPNGPEFPPKATRQGRRGTIFQAPDLRKKPTGPTRRSSTGSFQPKPDTSHQTRPSNYPEHIPTSRFPNSASAPSSFHQSFSPLQHGGGDGGGDHTVPSGGTQETNPHQGHSKSQEPLQGKHGGMRGNREKEYMNPTAYLDEGQSFSPDSNPRVSSASIGLHEDDSNESLNRSNGSITTQGSDESDVYIPDRMYPGRRLNSSREGLVSHLGERGKEFSSLSSRQHVDSDGLERLKTSSSTLRNPTVDAFEGVDRRNDGDIDIPSSLSNLKHEELKSPKVKSLIKIEKSLDNFLTDVKSIEDSVARVLENVKGVRESALKLGGLYGFSQHTDLLELLKSYESMIIIYKEKRDALFEMLQNQRDDYLPAQLNPFVKELESKLNEIDLALLSFKTKVFDLESMAKGQNPSRLDTLHEIDEDSFSQVRFEGDSKAEGSLDVEFLLGFDGSIADLQNIESNEISFSDSEVNQIYSTTNNLRKFFEIYHILEANGPTSNFFESLQKIKESLDEKLSKEQGGTINWPAKIYTKVSLESVNQGKGKLGNTQLKLTKVEALSGEEGKRKEAYSYNGFSIALKDFDPNKVIQENTYDIFKEDVEVIVNAANTAMIGGGGMDGLINSNAGGRIIEERKKMHAVYGDDFSTGEAFTTFSHALSSKESQSIRLIVHTVGPSAQEDSIKWSEEKDYLLSQAYKNACLAAHQHGKKSIAFPAISIGIFEYDKTHAAQAALKGIQQFMEENPDSPLKDIRLLGNFDALSNAANSS